MKIYSDWEPTCEIRVARRRGVSTECRLEQKWRRKITHHRHRYIHGFESEWRWVETVQGDWVNIRDRTPVHET